MNFHHRNFSSSFPLLYKLLNIGLLILTSFFIVILFGFFFLVFTYATHLYLTEHTDGYVAAVSWVVQQGNPLYHSLEAPERYSTIYGPSLFLIVGIFMKLFGHNLIAAKLPIVLSLILSLILLFWLLQIKIGFPFSVIGTAGASLAILAFGSTLLNVAFQVRSDSLILFCVILSLWGVVTQKRNLACLLCALGFGVAVNLKVTSILYFLPVYALLLSQYALNLTVVSLLLGCLVVLLPFALPQISLTNYLLWINLTKNHGLNLQLFRENLQAALILVFPLCFALFQSRILNPRDFQYFIFSNRRHLYMLAVGIVGTAIVAAKPGVATVAGGLYRRQFLGLSDRPLRARRHR